MLLLCQAVLSAHSSCHVIPTLLFPSVNVTSLNYNYIFIVWLFVCEALCLGLNSSQSGANCIMLWAVITAVQVSHGGFPLISHHTPAVIPALWGEGICHLAARFPLLSQDRSWALIYCEVSPGSLNLHAYRITEWRKRLTTRMTFSWTGYYAGPVQGLIKVTSFSAVSSVASHARVVKSTVAFMLGRLAEDMMQRGLGLYMFTYCLYACMCTYIHVYLFYTYVPIYNRDLDI